MTNSINIVGNLTDDPKYIPGDDRKHDRVFFSVASNRGNDENERTTFFPVTLFGYQAKNIHESLAKGQSVIVSGVVESYTKQVQIEGKDVNLPMLSVRAYEVGPSLRYGTTVFTKAARRATAEAEPLPAQSAPQSRRPVPDRGANDEMEAF